MDRRKFLGLSIAVVVALPAGLSAIDFRTTKPKSWDAEDVNGAIEALYGAEKPTEGSIKLKVPKIAENGGSIPVNVKSALDLESIAIFQDANPRATVAVFTVPENGIVNYSMRIKMRKTGKITVVAKARDGKLYTVSTGVEVSIGGCGG